MQQKTLDRLRSAMRARGVHAFLVVKRLSAFNKVRYESFVEITARLFAGSVLMILACGARLRN